MGFISNSRNESGASIASASTGNSKISKDYTFNASAQLLTVKNDDYESLLLALNLDDNIVIYNPLEESKGGSQKGCCVQLNYDTTSMEDDDELLVIYAPREIDNYLTILKDITTELRIMNLHLEQLTDVRFVDTNIEN